MDDSVKNLGAIKRELQVNGLVYSKAGWLEKSHHILKKWLEMCWEGKAGEARQVSRGQAQPLEEMKINVGERHQNCSG